MKNYPRRDAQKAKVKYDARKAVIDGIKMERGCARCGYAEHPAALHFDHLDHTTKSFIIATSFTRQLDVVLAEVEKCQVLCANCHAIKSREDEQVHRRAGRPRTNHYDENGKLIGRWGEHL